MQQYQHQEHQHLEVPLPHYNVQQQQYQDNNVIGSQYNNGTSNNNSSSSNIHNVHQVLVLNHSGNCYLHLNTSTSFNNNNNTSNEHGENNSDKQLKYLTSLVVSMQQLSNQ